MPKGDPSRIQNAINYQGGMAQNQLNNLRNQTTNQYQGLYNQYQTAANRGMQDYDTIMQNYQNFLNRPDYTMSPEYKGTVDKAIGGYGNFAQTGGFSPEDLQNIRARSVAPTRALFERGKAETARSGRLSGNAAGGAAAQAKLARDQAQAISDANVNANAGIAQMVQQGRLAGLSGLGQYGTCQK